MSPKRLLGIACGAGLLITLAAFGARAQTSVPPLRPRPHIEVNPSPRLLYRRCISWYEIQYRPSGTVLYPAKHCWWVRG